MLSNLRGLTCKLQIEAIDVLYASKQVKHVATTFQKMRHNSEHKFMIFYKHATKLCKYLNGDGFELSTLGFSKRFSHRGNPEMLTLEG